MDEDEIVDIEDDDDDIEIDGFDNDDDIIFIEQRQLPREIVIVYYMIRIGGL